MSSKPLLYVQKDTISSTLPANNAGNFDMVLGGFPGAIIEAESVDTTPVVKCYVKARADGTWRKWACYQQAVDTSVRTFREADTSITLAAGDQIIVTAPGFYAVRLDLQSGTSATLAGRTADELNMLLSAGLSGATTVAPGAAIQCYSFIADGTDELLISATARKLYGVTVFTKDATPVYVKLYDKATAPSEADTPVLRVGSTAESSGLGGGNNVVFPAGTYLALTNGLGVRIVTGLADNDDTAVTTAENYVNVFWSA